MTMLLLTLLVVNLDSQDLQPRIGFLPYKDLGDPLIAYQDKYAYTVRLDRFGRPCPTGDYLLAKALSERLENVGLRREKYLTNRPNGNEGYYLFNSGRLLNMEYAGGEGRHSIYRPHVDENIISINEHMLNDAIDPRSISNYGTVFKKVSKPLSDYKIINQLPGRFYAYNSKNGKMLEDSGIADYPKQPTPFVEAPPTADDLKHTFVPDYSTRYAIRFRNLIYTVTIDKETGHYLFEDFARKMDASTASRTELPPWLLKPRQPDESVYEHKQGMLIPGFLHDIGTEEWVFVPDLGGKCIPMEPYLKTYHPHSRRIYNLPGKFEVKK
jgi:hypothetical protein